MLTGKELGAAIRSAAELKKTKTGATLADMARHFHVKPPSVNDWLVKGTIGKGRLPALWLYFSDVVGPEHWGLASFPQARVPGEVFEEITESERQLLEDFRSLTDPEQEQYAKEIAAKAELLRAYLRRQLQRVKPIAEATNRSIDEGPPLVPTVEQASSKPAEQFGLPDLDDDEDTNAGSRTNHGGPHGKDRGRP